MSQARLDNLESALIDFYRRPSQAANRMGPIQEVVKAELESRCQTLGSQVEVSLEKPVRGKHRSKNWDVVLYFARRPQLAVSTKSIMANVAGTVPNRIDDAMGECVNVHAHDPGMVLGYLFVMNATPASQKTRDGRSWTDVFAESLASFSGRRSERDAPELFEAATLLPVDFTTQPPQIAFHPRLLDWSAFFDILVGQVRARNPLVDHLLSHRPS